MGIAGFPGPRRPGFPFATCKRRRRCGWNSMIHRRNITKKLSGSIRETGRQHARTTNATRIVRVIGVMNTKTTTADKKSTCNVTPP